MNNVEHIRQHNVEHIRQHNEEYIRQHREDDVRQLALRKVPEGIDMVWCLQQIEGWQLARKKLPQWAAAEGIWFPPRLSMEQCSSEATAQYKRSIVERLIPVEERTTYVDLTGGFGIDFSYMAKGFQRAVYVERMEHLCELAKHNLSALVASEKPSLANAQNGAKSQKFQIINAEAEELVQKGAFLKEEKADIIFLDPARRDDVGRKVVALEDCSPNVLKLLPWLLEHARYVILKLSPMLDITQAKRQLSSPPYPLKGESGKGESGKGESDKGEAGKGESDKGESGKGEKRLLTDVVREVHVVSVQGECKEVLMVLSQECEAPLTYHCVNLETPDEDFVCDEETRQQRPVIATKMESGQWLFEPNASLLKAGVQDALCVRYGMQKVHPMSNLFCLASDPSPSGEGTSRRVFGYISHTKVSPLPVWGGRGVRLPGRLFAIEAVSDFSKAGIKSLLAGMKQANLTIRNFPGTVAELRKRLKLKEGGSVYLFATTLCDGSHCLMKCRKA